MKKESSYARWFLVGAVAVLILGFTTDQIMNNVYDQTNTALRATIVSGGGTPVPVGTAYVTVENEATPLTQRNTLNFIGGPIDCVDNSGATRTDCTVFTPVPGVTGSGTANTVTKFTGTSALGNSSVTDDGSIVTLSTNIDAASKGYAFQIANDTSTGTTTNKVVTLTATYKGIVAPTSATDGALGICVSGCGITGSGTIVGYGVVPCVFDGATTVGDLVTFSSGTAGDCHDSGATTPANGTATFARVLSTNGGAGTYNVNFNTADVSSITNIKGGGGKTGVASGSANAIQLSAGSGQFTSDSGFTENPSTHVSALSSTVNAGLVSHTVANASGTPGSDAGLILSVSAGGASTGIPYVSFTGPDSTTGTTSWKIGPMHGGTTNQPFNLSWSSTFDAAHSALELQGGNTSQLYAGGDSSGFATASQPQYSFRGGTTTGVYLDSGGHLDLAHGATQFGDFTATAWALTSSNSGATSALSLKNLSNTASSDTALNLVIGGTSARQAYINFNDNNTFLWSMGSDEADSTKFKIGTGQGLQTSGNIALTIDTSKQVYITALKTTGSATGKTIVCVATATGQLFASTSGDTCAN